MVHVYGTWNIFVALEFDFHGELSIKIDEFQIRWFYFFQVQLWRNSFSTEIEQRLRNKISINKEIIT